MYVETFIKGIIYFATQTVLISWFDLCRIVDMDKKTHVRS